MPGWHVRRVLNVRGSGGAADRLHQCGELRIGAGSVQGGTEDFGVADLRCGVQPSAFVGDYGVDATLVVRAMIFTGETKSVQASDQACHGALSQADPVGEVLHAPLAVRGLRELRQGSVLRKADPVAALQRIRELAFDLAVQC